MLRSLAVALLLLASAWPATAAVDRAAVEKQFQAWLRTEARPAALAAGVSAATVEAAFNGLALDWGMPDLQPPGTPARPPKVNWQSEFGSPGAYFGEKNLSAVVAGGRARLAKWSKTLAAIERRTGVPKEIVVAIWGKESGFGAARLPKLAVRALATEAFMGWRKDFFLDEFIDALKILDHHDIAPDALRSSLAGALGQPQFMPSVFLSHAQDFDGDGRRDIWSSTPDTLASIAAFLADKGWNGKRTWGFEARVPATVSCALEGPDQGQPMTAWARLGVTRVDGAPLPRDNDGPVFLLMPAGRYGPAFIVTENFYVLKEYNYSDLYALYIGHAADRMRVNRPFAASWGNVGGFRRGDVKAMQDALVKQGYDVGAVDGLVGYKTRIAVGLWQAKRGQPATCFPDAGMVRTLR